MAVIMDGKALATQTKERLRVQADALGSRGIVPGLAVVLVGDDPASAIYVRNKERDCAECGIKSFPHYLSHDTAQTQLLDLIASLNADDRIHGILVQLPLPRHLEEQAVIAAIHPLKDVDAFHPENVGLICQGRPRFRPCTPAGVMALLDRYAIDPCGRHCVVAGRSNIVGKPQALLLLERHATITICHSRTPDLAAQTRRADILVSAVGRPGLITADMLKPDAVVIDVAINRSPQGELCGDVDFAACEPIASHITPVPGGVGPMTRAMLMENTLTAAHLLTTDS